MKIFRKRTRANRRSSTSRGRLGSLLRRSSTMSLEPLELRSMLAADGLAADSAYFDSAGTIDVSVRSLLASCMNSPAAEETNPTETTSIATSFTSTSDDSASDDSDQIVEPLVDEFQATYALETQDLAGNPITSVNIDQDFKLAVFVQDVRVPPPALGSGVFAAYTNISFNSSLASINSSQTIVYGDFFNFVRTGNLTTDGQIAGVGASTTNSTPPGSARQFLFSVVVHADAAGTLTFTSSADTAPGHDTLLFLSDEAVPDEEVDFGSVQISVNDTPQFSIGNVTAAEGTNASVKTPMVFTVNLSIPSDQQTTVQYNTAAGSAATPADFVANSGTLTFAPGETQHLVTVLVEADAIDEDDETFTVTLSNPTVVELGNAVATGTITDDDAAPTISIGTPLSPGEGDAGVSPLVFTVQLSGNATSKPVTVQYATANDTAQAGSDYTATSGTLTFAPGVTTQFITVSIIGDVLDENDEIFAVNLSAPTNATLDTSSGFGTIDDDDEPPTVSLGDATIVEGDSGSQALVFTASLSAVSSKTITAQYATGDGTALTADGDYNAATGTITFAPGTTTQTITVTVNADVTNEADETFNVTLTNQSNVTLADATGVGTIENDDQLPELSISSANLFEGDADTTLYVFTVFLSAVSGQIVTVNYATDDGSATAGSDYAGTTGSLTFLPGDTFKTLTVAVSGDTDREENEQFTLALSNPVNAALSTDPGQGVGIITNDDGPYLSFTLANVSNAEGNSGTTDFVFAVRTGNTDSEQVTVVYATHDGTATTADNDYVAASGTLTFAPGESVQFITILVNGDNRVEGNETFSMVLSSPTNATIEDDSTTGTIENDDELLIGLSDGTATEANDGQTSQMVFTVILSSASEETVTVQFDTPAGTALAGTDYTATSGTLTFAPGTTQQFITVTVLGDLADEPDESFTVRLFNSTNASNALTEETAVTSTGTIIDNDAEPAVTLTPGTVSIAEGNSGSATQVFTVTLSQASGKTVTVNFATADGTAIAGTDYTANSGTLTFAPGATQQLITVLVTGDTIDEDNETFTVNLTTPSNATLSSQVTSIATITDDDAAPTLSISDVSQQEGNSGATNFVFTVTLSGDTSRTVTVNFSTAAGTAIAGTDFTATSGTLTFAPGTTQQLITVSVTGDTTNEASENFVVNLSNPSNATLADGQGSPTIQNDDALPTLSINDVSQVEGDSGTTAFVFTVTLSAASGQQVTVGFATANDTGSAPDDYIATSGTLTFAPGTTTQTITVNVVGDLFEEANETFLINLSSANNATIADGQGIGTIQNGNDAVVDTVSTIAGFAFIDGDKQNDHDAGELGIEGVSVFLTSEGETFVGRQTSTDVNGAYSFANLMPGTYNVFFAQPLNYKTGEADPGSHGGTLLSGNQGFRITIDSPGGINSTENNFFVDGMHPDYISQRQFLASTAPGAPDALYLGLSITSATENINSTNATNASISGTGEPGASVSVTVTDGTDSTAQQVTTIAANGTWSITGINVTSLDDGPLVYEVTATNSLGHTTNALRNATKDTTGPTIDISTVTNPVGSNNVSNVTASGSGEVGASLSIVATDGTTTTPARTTIIAAGGTWSVSGFNLSALNDGTITFTVTATDAAGNTSTDTITTTKDTVAPSVAITSVTDPSNSASAANTTISGTGTAGATISVVVSNGGTSTPAQTTTVTSGGTWSISGINISSLGDGTVTYTATASDAAGNTSTATRTALKDTSAPAVAVTVSTSPVNAGNVTNTTASGTGEVGATISLVVTDGTHTTAALTTTVGAGGTWSITGINVSSLDDGTITYQATATDSAGNTGTATKTSTKDIVAPTVELAEVTDPINAADSTDVTASGTGEVGATISLTATDGTTTTTALTTTVGAGGTWSITGIDVSSLDDGTITFNVTATDTAGNTATDSLTAQLDTTAPAVAISEVSEPINNNNVTSASAIGTGEVGATISLTVTDGTTTTTALTTTVGAGGTWTITDIDVSGLDDGTITYNVTATDGAGNTATDSETADNDTLEVPFTLVTDPIGIVEATAVAAGGTGEAGATIKVIATDGTNDTTEYTTTVATDGTWSILDIDVSNLDDGTITFDVTMTDAGGNTTTDSITAEKDTVAPTVELTSLTDPINATAAANTAASGTGEVGASISVVASDGTTTTSAQTTTVDGGGTWSIVAIDVSALDDGTITYTVTATDEAGNTSTDTLTGEKDTVAPAIAILLVTDPVFSGNVATTSASGTGEVGALISLAASDGTNHSIPLLSTVAGDGTWSIVDVDVSGLADGPITFTVSAVDAVGNIATDNLTATKDVTSPPVDITTATTPLHANNVSSASASGTGEDGATISLVVTDGVVSTSAVVTTVAGGVWSFAGLDLSALADGPITYMVTATDTAGNTATDTFAAQKDTIAPTVDLLLVIDPVNAANASATSAGGSGEVGATISLTATDGTNFSAVFTTTVAGDGNWVIVDIDVSSLNDGTITFLAKATDAAGNDSLADSLTAEKDTVAPVVEITAATDPIDPGNETSAAISGTGEVGAAIQVFVTDTVNNSTVYDTVVAGDGTWSIIDIDVSGLDDGTITYMVTATDAAGNTATDSVDATKDSIVDLLMAGDDDFGDSSDVESNGSGQGFAANVDSALEDELSWL